MLNKIYLYAVGAVLVLGLVIPVDANAGSVQICINGSTLVGQPCGNSNNAPMRSSRPIFCINGSTLGGQPCSNSNNAPMGSHRPNKIKATGYDALEIITHSSEITSGVSNNGWAYFVVRYQGNRFNNLRNRIFSCKVSPEASSFECFSWPTYR